MVIRPIAAAGSKQNLPGMSASPRRLGGGQWPGGAIRTSKALRRFSRAATILGHTCEWRRARILDEAAPSRPLDCDPADGTNERAGSDPPSSAAFHRISGSCHELRDASAKIDPACPMPSLSLKPSRDHRGAVGQHSGCRDHRVPFRILSTRKASSTMSAPKGGMQGVLRRSRAGGWSEAETVQRPGVSQPARADVHVTCGRRRGPIA